MNPAAAKKRRRAVGLSLRDFYPRWVGITHEVGWRYERWQPGRGARPVSPATERRILAALEAVEFEQQRCRARAKADADLIVAARRWAEARRALLNRGTSYVRVHERWPEGGEGRSTS